MGNEVKQLNVIRVFTVIMLLLLVSSLRLCPM